jgi:hypothetical protein
MFTRDSFRFVSGINSTRSARRVVAKKFYFFQRHSVFFFSKNLELRIEMADSVVYPRGCSVRGVDRTFLRRTTLAELEREHAERQRTGQRRYTLSSMDKNVVFDSRFPQWGPDGEELGYTDQYLSNKLLMQCMYRWGSATVQPPSAAPPGYVDPARASSSLSSLGIEDSTRMSAVQRHTLLSSKAAHVDEDEKEDSLTVSEVTAASLYRDSHAVNPAVVSEVLTTGRQTAASNPALGSRGHFNYFAAAGHSGAQSDVLLANRTTATLSNLSDVAGAAVNEGGSAVELANAPQAAAERQLRFTTCAASRQSAAHRPSAALPLFHYPAAVETATCSQPTDGGFDAIDSTQIADCIEQNLTAVFGSSVVDCTQELCPPLMCDTHVLLCNRQLYISAFLGNDTFEAASAEDGQLVLLYKWSQQGALLNSCESTRAVLGHRIIAPSREVYGVAFADGGITVIATECRSLPLGTVLLHGAARLAATKAFLLALMALLSRRVIHGDFTPQNIFLCEDGTIVATHWEAATDFTMFADGLAGCTKLLALETKGERRLRGFDADLISVHQWQAFGLPRGPWATIGEQLRNRPTRWADYMMSLRSVIGSLPMADMTSIHEAFASTSFN